MWTIVKFDKNKLSQLKGDLCKKLGSSPKIYLPKIKIQKQKNNKIYYVDNFLLGNYMFCYHDSFSIKGIINSLKYCRGLKYFLVDFIFSQEELSSFIKNCKNHEDKNGYIKQSFFAFEKNQNFKFISGPFGNKIFSIIKENRKKLKILIENIEVTVSKNNNYLFRPV